jgi:hypothetical protein
MPAFLKQHWARSAGAHGLDERKLRIDKGARDPGLLYPDQKGGKTCVLQVQRFVVKITLSFKRDMGIIDRAGEQSIDDRLFFKRLEEDRSKKLEVKRNEFWICQGVQRSRVRLSSVFYLLRFL